MLLFYPNFSKEDMHKYLHCFEMDMDVNLGALSMGQKKKVFMSFALATNTSLLLMDEPTNGLDIPGKSQFRKFLASGMSDDKTIVISTHQVRALQSTGPCADYGQQPRIAGRIHCQHLQ